MLSTPRTKVALIAPLSHAEVLRTLWLLLEETPIQVQVYASPNNIDILNTEIDTKSWIIIPQGLSSLSKTWNFNNYDLVIFISLSTEYKRVLLISKNCNSLLIIHNGHTTFCPKEMRQIFSFYSLASFIKHVIFNKSRQLNNLLQNVSAISLPSDLIHAHLLNHISDISIKNKITGAIPFTFFEEIPSIEESDFTMVIPGTVDPNRKYYKILIPLLRQLNETTKRSIRIVFAGELNSAHSTHPNVKSIMELNLSNISTIFYTHALNSVEYRKCLQKAHCLLLVPKKNYTNGHILEKYGFSNISGGINDMIRFGKITLVPNFYPLDKTVAFLAKYYSSISDIVHIVTEVMNNPVNLMSDSRCCAFITNYDKASQQNNLLNLINQLII